MTHHLPTDNHPQPSRRRATPGLRIAVAIGTAMGATVFAAGTAQADPTETSASYQLGYTRAVKDGQLTASRARAEGLSPEFIVVSTRIPALCAKESASVQSFPGFNGPDFMRGCADGMKTLVESGVVR
ncbi:hypothetical protein [Mycobacterium decipiens]|uniref:Uncharacterized protein n=1 Tax=Mycobacterium decipiens TaxID=1430326 RepID=A0A1X2LP67_9MYCO|nr:hypothetical protein [Mycobacterium decipiens]OSC36751.1 hypothetical protein B8W66_22490 [Mycobacterium decipiens]